MAHGQQLTTVGTWSGTNVDADTVQARLTHFWRTSAKTAAQHGQPAAARTSVLTLVAYVEDQAALERATEAIADLIEYHPSRAILVLAESDADEPALDADVSTRCLVARPQVCHEQIVLHARGHMVEQVSSAVASLLVHDLPTFLWWPGNVTDQTEVLLRLLGMCNRLIVDSSRFVDPAASFRVLSRLMARSRALALTDAQWARLTVWRDMTAQFFDAGATRAYLPALDRVTIDVDAPEGDLPSGPASLYAGWLGSRLGWQVATPPMNASHFTVTAGGRPVTIEVRPRRDGSTIPGQLAAVTLHADLAGREASLIVERQGDDQVSTHAEGEDLPAGQRTMRSPILTDAAMLQQELAIFDHDHIYEASLSWLRGLLPTAGAQP